MPTIFGRTREKYFPSIVSQDQVRPNGSSPELRRVGGDKITLFTQK